MEFEDLISIDSKKVDEKRRSLEELLIHGTPSVGGGLEQRALADYGISWWTFACAAPVIRRRCAKPIFERIRSERNMQVAKYQSEGAKEAEKIKSDAERKVREKLAAARQSEQIIKGQADAEATELRNQAYAKDAQFYAFLKKLEEYQHILGDNKTTLLLSAGRELFDLLFAAAREARRQSVQTGRQDEGGRSMTPRRTLIAVLIVLLVAYLLTGVTQVRSDERAVVRRFGRVLDYQAGPGLWIGLPWGMERVDRVRVDEVRRVEVGYQPDADEDSPTTPPGQFLTGDHNLVNLQVVVNYAVLHDQLVDYVLHADEVDSLVSRATETVIAEWVAGQTVDDVLLVGKVKLPEEVIAKVPQRLADYHLGIAILESVSVTHLLPPPQVKAAFDQVTQAQTEAERARITRNRKRPRPAPRPRRTNIAWSSWPPPMLGRKSSWLARRPSASRNAGSSTKR